MNQRIKAILADAQKLSSADREELADLLLASLEVDPEMDTAWVAEIERRMADLDRGAASLVPVEDVLAELRRS